MDGVDNRSIFLFVIVEDFICHHHLNKYDTHGHIL